MKFLTFKFHKTLFASRPKIYTFFLKFNTNYAYNTLYFRKGRLLLCLSNLKSSMFKFLLLSLLSVSVVAFNNLQKCSRSSLLRMGFENEIGVQRPLGTEMLISITRAEVNIAKDSGIPLVC